MRSSSAYSRTATAASRSSRAERPMRTMQANAPAFMKPSRARRRFSSTVIAGKTSTFWNVRAIPLRATRCGFRPTSSAPPNRTEPDCGR